MLSRIFIAISALPGAKKRLWRTVYNYLAGMGRADGWTFMNYGFALSDGKPVTLEPVDEPDRHCIQLYDHVTGAVDLRGKDVLEVGSGRGGGASFIKRYRQPVRMIGVDLSIKAVELCREIHPSDGLEFHVGDAESLPLQDGSVDAVINVESSHCYPEFEEFLSEVHRVLRPGGWFLYADFRDQANVPAWRESLTRSGLTLIRETDITGNVVLALDRDNERKANLIDRFVPRLFRSSFNDFAGMRGTVVYEGLRERRFIYRSFVLQKPGQGAEIQSGNQA